ncbi:hypothetical protein [Halorhabdus rudnickae]|uniref:hypothetical protein n=1 Tax=Halorhabdus rudnickae TaxID=1775544 RepID=UPI0010840F35|nr:hypothetical protein [Halorhabdus rudnickae]
MSEEDFTQAAWKRRSLLKAAATTIGVGTVPFTALGDSPPAAVGRKGDRTQPVKKKHIENARSDILSKEEYASNGSRQAILSEEPVPKDRYVAGYVIKIENGAPTEHIFEVHDPKIIPKKEENIVEKDQKRIQMENVMI